MSGKGKQEEELQLDATAAAGADASGKVGGVKGKRFLLIGIVLLVVALAAGGYFYFKYKYQPAHTPPPTDKAAEAAAPKTPLNHYFEVNDIATNLSPTNDKDSWIKVSLALQLENSKDQSVLDKKLPLIKDSVLIFLREIRAADLASSGGTMMLKAELIKRINKVIYPVKLKDMLFKEILIDK